MMTHQTYRLLFSGLWFVLGACGEKINRTQETEEITTGDLAGTGSVKPSSTKPSVCPTSGKIQQNIGDVRKELRVDGVDIYKCSALFVFTDPNRVDGDTTQQYAHAYQAVVSKEGVMGQVMTVIAAPVGSAKSFYNPKITHNDDVTALAVFGVSRDLSGTAVDLGASLYKGGAWYPNLKLPEATGLIGGSNLDRSIATDHNGNIYIVSTVGKGANIYITVHRLLIGLNTTNTNAEWKVSVVATLPQSAVVHTPRIATNGQDVVVAFTQGGDIKSAGSSNFGLTFSIPTIVNRNGGVTENITFYSNRTAEILSSTAFMGAACYGISSRRVTFGSTFSVQGSGETCLATAASMVALGGSSTAGAPYYIRLATGSADTAVMAFQYYKDGAPPQLAGFYTNLALMYRKGGVWQDLTSVMSTDPGYNSTTSDHAIAMDGKAFVNFTKYGAEKAEARTFSGQNLVSSYGLDVSNTKTYELPIAIAAHPNGNQSPIHARFTKASLPGAEKAYATVVFGKPAD